MHFNDLFRKVTIMKVMNDYWLVNPSKENEISPETFMRLTH